MRLMYPHFYSVSFFRASYNVGFHDNLCEDTLHSMPTTPLSKDPLYNVLMSLANKDLWSSVLDHHHDVMP